MDDIILKGNDKEEVKQPLNKTFNIKDLGNLRYFIGLEITRRKKGIMMNQRKYTLELLTYAGFLACEPAITPIDNLVKLSFTESLPFTNV